MIGFGSQSSASCVIRAHVIRSLWLRPRVSTSLKNCQTDYCPAIAPITMLSSAGHGSRAAAPDSWVATRLLRGIPADRRSFAR
jgi:hypothetical protein